MFFCIVWICLVIYTYPFLERYPVVRTWLTDCIYPVLTLHDYCVATVPSEHVVVYCVVSQVV